METKSRQWKVLKSEPEYKEALNRTIEIFHAEDGTVEADELDLLLLLVKDFEDKHIVIPTPDPLEVIKLKMNEKGLKMKDLEPIIGSKGHVSSVLSGKKELTLKMVKKLHDFLGIPAEVFINTNRTVPIS
ncbi:MAG TPA: helix-turn-helix domain-containing protein [Mucilaginibacter sp.]|nr:helix-turn-helix domain-containing protein [Mucilaginibacter sp.]